MKTLKFCLLKNGGSLALWRRAAFVCFLVLAGLPTVQGPVAAEDPLPAFYPAPPDTARFQFLRRIYTSDDLSKQSWFNRLVMGKKPAYGFGKPYGITAVGSGLFVADTQLNLVVKIDLSKDKMTAFSQVGTHRFDKVVNLDHDSDGNVWVADAGAKKVIVMTPDGKMVRSYEDLDSIEPIDVGVAEDQFYLIDRDSHQVYRFDLRSGENLGAFDASTDSLGLVAPTNLVVSDEGDVYVVDSMNCRVLRFDAEGTLQQVIGGQGVIPGFFARPKGIALDPEGLVLVADAAFENVQVLRPEDGRPLTFLGGPGQLPGQMWIPAGVAVGTELIDSLRDYVFPGVEISYVVAVASQFGPPHVDLYGRIENVFGFAREHPPEDLARRLEEESAEENQD